MTIGVQDSLTPEELEAIQGALGVGGDDDPETFEEEVGIERTTQTWQDGLLRSLEAQVKAQAKANGYDQNLAVQWLYSNYSDLVQWVDNSLISREDFGIDSDMPLFDPSNPADLQSINAVAQQYLNASWPGFFGGAPQASGGGGRGGGGPRRPTASEIRAQFDLDELAGGANDIWRAMLWDDPEDPRGIARAYVDAVVANPEQKLDYQTFVEQRARQTSRYETMYKMKPDGLSEVQYTSQLGQQAFQVLGGSGGQKDRLGRVVAQGAALGATPDAFRGRLSRTREATNSNGFMGGIEQKLRAARGVLRS